MKIYRFPGSPFVLHAPFEPAGDQPKAIEELVRRIESGEKYSVLLGATGTGKSLHPEEPVVIRERRGDKVIWRMVGIGTFVEEMAKRYGVLSLGEDAVVPLPEDRFFTVSFSPETLEVRVSPIYALSYHWSDTLYEVVLEDGRRIRTTGDHNFYVLTPEGLKLKRVSEITREDYVPLPRAFPKVGGGLEGIYITDYVPKRRKRTYVEVEDEEVLKEMVHLTYGEKAAVKFRAVRRGETGIPIYKIPNKILKKFKKSIKIRTSRGKITDNFIPIDRDFLEFIGLYVAEGRGEDGYVLVSTTSPYYRGLLKRIARRFGLKLGHRDHKDTVLYGSVLSDLLTSLCGRTSKDKRLPDFWPNLSDEQLSHILRGIFDGDGTVRNGEISLTTSSDRLANDILYALLRLGIWGRVRKVFKRATSSSHNGAFYNVIRLYGKEAEKFFRKVGFNIPHKADGIGRLLSTIRNTNVDVIPHVGKRIRERRKRMGLAQREVATGLSRAAVSAIELGKRFPSVETFLKITDSLKAHRLERLAHLRWVRVKGIRKLPYSGKVYDLSVEGDETFLSGFGGVFVHNTYTIAHVIARVGKPTLILSHNKTLAAQLYGELKGFFPENAVEYFISYYDYYQPEAYIPQTDTYIPKEATINDDIERLRLRTVSSLLTREDVIVVASVSAIYALDDPSVIRESFLTFRVGDRWNLKDLALHLVSLHYERNDIDLQRGRFRIRGDVLDIIPAYEEFILRIEFWGDEIERMRILEPVSMKALQEVKEFTLWPASHFLGGEERLKRAIKSIEMELEERLKELRAAGKLLEAQRLEQRTRYDLELLRTTGRCPGIENYSRHISGRPPGSRPWTLLDYFPEDYLMVIDESHVTIPQLRAMYEGDRSRKLTLIEHGFRLPSALDNRPLKFEELEELWPQVVFMSATPGPYELEKTGGEVVEQIVRPTGVPDPIVEVRPLKGMMDDLLEEIRRAVERGDRVLITTLTKRSAEEVSDYLKELGIRAGYLHSELDAIERVKILRDLRLGEIDVLVGVNLLREGLDLPEVSLVAITDADKSGFLRSYTALIQTIGRAARNAAGKVILYADEITEAMRRAIEETERRRRIQLEYNRRHGIVPRTVKKSREEIMRITGVADERVLTSEEGEGDDKVLKAIEEILKRYRGQRAVKKLKSLMLRYAENLEFEKAAVVRDKLREMGEVV